MAAAEKSVGESTEAGDGLVFVGILMGSWQRELTFSGGGVEVD